MTTHGADMKSAGRYITAAVSAGIIGGNDINLVNSAVVAKEKGFEVFINPEFNLNSLSLFKMWSCQLGITCHVVNNFKMFEKNSGLLCGHECGSDHNNVEIVFPLSVNGNIMNEITEFIYVPTQLIKHFRGTYI